MRVAGKRQLKAGKQHGFSLLELLIVCAIAGVILSALAGAFFLAMRYTRIVASRTIMQRQTRIYLQDCRETISGAGTNALNLAGDRAIIRDERKQNKPAAFISEEGNTLTVLQTNQTGEAGIITGAGSNRLFLAHADWQQWQSILPYSYVMAVNQLGPPAILQLTSAPAQVTDGEIPAELGKYNADNTVSIQVQPVSELGGLIPLTNTYTETAKIVPIVRIVRYFADDEGIERSELEAVNPEAVGFRPTAPSFYTTSMTPGMKSKLGFRYVATTGEMLKLPSDLSLLRAIRIKTAITDPDTGFTQEDSYDVTVDAWR